MDENKQALLTEYQMCQEDILSSFQAHWTLAGIFIGISTAILGGVIYGILANKDVLSLFIRTVKEISPNAQDWEIWAIRIIISILSVGIIFMLYNLIRWLKREQFLAYLNYERMQDIEKKHGLWKSQRVSGIDNWSKLDAVVMNRLLSHKPMQWWSKKGNYPHKPWFPGYEPPSSRFHYRRIMFTLIGLWILLVLSVWIPPLIFRFI